MTENLSGILHVHQAFKYISLTSTARLRRETSEFSVLWRTWTYDDKFSFPFLNLNKTDKILTNSTPGKVACIWHIERVQIDAIRFESTRIIHHNQLLMTKFGRILCLTRKWGQNYRVLSFLQVKAPLTEKTWGRGCENRKMADISLPWVPEVFLACRGNFWCWPKTWQKPGTALGKSLAPRQRFQPYVMENRE